MDKTPYKIGKTEKFVLNVMQNNAKYIVKDSLGRVYLFGRKPFKNIKKGIWQVNEGYFTKFIADIDFVSWEDDEPLLISEVLDNCI